jgi:pyruvate formate lyase activating enzyme
VTIVGWHKTSFIDFPGTVATVLFFSGCNCACPWCHNPGVVRGEYPVIPESEVLAFIDKRLGTIEGVVLSGGEATLHDGLPRFVAELRRRKVAIKLDTNGLLPEAIERCAPDYLALDIKTVPIRYSELGCRIPDVAERLARSIAIVTSMGAGAEIRITVAPGYIDEAVVAALAILLTDVAKVFLQPLQTGVQLLDPTFAEKPIVPMERMLRYREILSQTVGSCNIRGEA